MLAQDEPIMQRSSSPTWLAATRPSTNTRIQNMMARRRFNFFRGRLVAYFRRLSGDAGLGVVALVPAGFAPSPPVEATPAARVLRRRSIVGAERATSTVLTDFGATSSGACRNQSFAELDVGSSASPRTVSRNCTPSHSLAGGLQCYRGRWCDGSVRKQGLPAQARRSVWSRCARCLHRSQQHSAVTTKHDQR